MELLWVTHRNVFHETFGTANRRCGIADRDWRQHFHHRAGGVSLLGSGHSLAAFFQAWMYIATIAWSLRRNRWNYFIGISVASFWDYTNIVATSFFWNGLQQLGQWIHSGHLARPDLLIAVPAWFSNLLVIIGCLWAYSKLEDRRASDVMKFLVCFVLATGFFAADMAIFQPRYLGLFPRLLHPHLPW